MTVDPTVPLGTLTPNTTFLYGSNAYVVVSGTMPPPDSGKVWFCNLTLGTVDQDLTTLPVIPVPLKVVHA